MRENTVRPSQQSLEDILQGVQDVEVRLGKTVETVKGIKETVQGINAKLDKTFEKRDELDKKLRDLIQSTGAKCDERFDEFGKKLDQLANFVAIFTAAPNTTFERARL